MFYYNSTVGQLGDVGIRPYYQAGRLDSIKKDSRSARRVDRSRQRQARLHTVGFGLARAGGPIVSLRVEWPKASLLCGTQVTRVRIDGGVI